MSVSLTTRQIVFFLIYGNILNENPQVAHKMIYSKST